ncbi:M23 family metallopeptidase [Staphylococcus edaphicus]|uniref:lysostaphin n=1 Tax=Staphylococcus edaphicus TaxID=1955013 RepID=A0A2C6WQE4_9STAP|nr:peptidoglycan DD-metalloendopeptidase family protein [Staphylococcus edaphicus]PHK50014.1 peptidase M23 [Staphylococcus edaphicus]UQW81725.1 M23 family metallopeptidase [Staphylococcus edaphicus]
MKKIVTATIATLSLGAIGIAQSEAQASETDQSNTQYTGDQSSNNMFNYGFIDQDENGNYHHTLDGNWNPSMFEQQQYYFYLIDEEGNYHYYYFPMDNSSQNTTVNSDNNYTENQSHQDIQEQGYDVNKAPVLEGKNSSNDVSAQTSSNQVKGSNTQATENASNYASYTRNDGNGVNNIKQNETSNEITSDASNGTNTTTISTSASQQNDADNTTAVNNSNNTNSSNWLTKNRQLQPYGQYHGGGAHYGVDYAMDENTPVYSLTDGTVIQSGWSNYGGGNQVTIQEKNSDNYQWYMHMNSLNVKKGQQVKEGQQIGASGSTGNSTAPHLHFQRMNGGVGNQYSVDPTSYVNSKA